MKLQRKIVCISAFLFFMVIALAFPFGPLFPWSPIKLGYQSVIYARSDVFVTDTKPVTPDFALLDQFMNEAESFHQLHFRRRLKVIECKDWGTCQRGVPWMNVSPLGGVTLAGDVIYITPKLKEKNFSTEQFLRHELSHALIGQNTSLLNIPKLVEQTWFYEGLAVSFGRQQDYVNRDEWLKRATTTNLTKYLDPALRQTEWEWRFAYPTQRYFNEWLKDVYGVDQYQQFLTQNIMAPTAWRETFRASFLVTFTEATQRYEREVRTAKWLPVE